MPPRDKTRQVNAQEALARSFDKRASALTVIPSQPVSHYADSEDVAYHTRAIAADDAAPNAVAPVATQYARTMGDAEVFFHLELAAGTAADIEVWARTDIGGDTTTWIMVERFPAIESMREYRCRCNYRMAFLRCVNTVALAADPATLRATGA